VAGCRRGGGEQQPEEEVGVASDGRRVAGQQDAQADTDTQVSISRIFVSDEKYF
jgi:hypothetical protein